MKKETRMKHIMKGLTHTIRNGGIVHMFLAYKTDEPYEEGELIEYREGTRKEAKADILRLGNPVYYWLDMRNIQKRNKIAINFFGPAYMVHDMYYMHRSIFFILYFFFYVLYTKI